MTHPLLEAFLATRYRICLDDIWIETRVGDVHPVVADWLRRNAAKRASLVSACNPEGVRSEPYINEVRDDELRLELAESGYRLYLAEGVAADGSWQEPALFVPNLAGKACRYVMECYDQLAWVEYDATGLARLRWTRDPTWQD
jgi:hypothetical protein